MTPSPKTPDEKLAEEIKDCLYNTGKFDATSPERNEEVEQAVAAILTAIKERDEEKSNAS